MTTKSVTLYFVSDSGTMTMRAVPGHEQQAVALVRALDPTYYRVSVEEYQKKRRWQGREDKKAARIEDVMRAGDLN